MDSPKLNIGDITLNTFHTGTDLHTAAVNGDKLTIERILNQQGDIQTLNKGDKYGRTALVYTVFGDWYECAEILVRHGASIQQIDVDKRSVLHWAAYLDRPKFIKLFLEHVDSNLECNFGDKDGRTALHYAAMQANSKCLRLLLKRLMLNKRTLNTTDNEQMSALHWSVFYNRLENFKLLLREGADTTKWDVKGRCLLHMAVLNPNADSVRIARILLKLNRHMSRKFDYRKCTSLHLAVANGNQELVRELCMAEESALNDLDDLSRSVLHYAVLRNDIELINILISAGVLAHHVDNTGATVLHYAAKNDNAQIVRRFLDCYKNFEDSTDYQGRTALVWAASEGSLDVLKLMLKNLSYFNIHASDEQGLTALHFACFAGHEECVQLLIENSADISQPDKLGQTALFKACQQGHRKIIDILMGRTGHRGAISDVNGHGATFMDNDGYQVNTRQGMLKDNTATIGTHLFSIQEESVVSMDTLKTSEWSHDDERGHLLPRDKGSLSRCYTSEGPKPEGKHDHRMKEFNSWEHMLRTMDLGEFSKACIDREFPSERLGIHELEDDNGCTPLHFAAHAGHTPVCTWLLSEGVDPGKKDVQGRTALHGAAFKGHTECMALMLSHDPDLVNDRDNDGYSVLHHAAINGQLEAVKLIVSDPLQAFLNYRVKSTDWTPLDFAMAADHQDVIQFLMDNGALTIAWLQDVAADKIKKFLRRLVLRRREATVKPLIERHNQLTKEENLKHCENEDKIGKDDVIDGITNHDVIVGVIRDDVTTDNVAHDDVVDEVTHDKVRKSGVIDDVIYKNNETVGCHGNDDVIKEQSTQETKENNSREAVKCKDTMHNDLESHDDRFTADNDQLRTLTESENKMNSNLKSENNRSTTDDEQLRTFASMFGETEICDNTKQILLLDACYHGDVARVQKLLQGNIDLGYRNENGCTALHFAAAQGNDTICEYLLEHGAATYTRDINGRTALHKAAIAGNAKCVSLLLSYNKDLTSCLDCDHRSTLHYAASMGHLDAVRLLLSENSRVQDVRAKSTPLTALDCAILRHHDDVIEFMISKGLQPSGLLDRAARVIQTSCRKWLERKIISVETHGEPFKNTENGLINNQDNSKNGQNREKVIKNTEYGLVKNEKPLKNGQSGEKRFKNTQNGLKNHENPSTLSDSCSKVKCNKTHHSVHEIYSGIQSKYSTLEPDQNSSPTNSNPIRRLSENFSDGIKSNPETDYEYSRRGAIDGFTHSKYLPDSSNFSSPMRDNSARSRVSTGLTFAQSNIENLSRAPESVIVAGGEKERIFQLRNNWERIALLRRKKQAALVIQRHFRKHLETSKGSADDKNAIKECETEVDKRDIYVNAKKQPGGISLTQNHEKICNLVTQLDKNRISMHVMTVAFNSTKELDKNSSSMPDKTLTSPQTTDSDNLRETKFSKSNRVQSSQQNKVDSSSGVYIQETPSPKRLTRKAVVNRLRTTSPEYSSSENEPSREKREYKSTFPLLSPKSSTSANGRSHGNQSVNQLPTNRRANPLPSNRRVDVQPMSPKSSSTSSNRSPSNPSVNNRHANSSPSNRRVDVAPILSKNDLVNQWLSDALVSGNSSNTKITNKQVQNEISNSEARSGKTDPSKGDRRLSSHSARVRRDSLIKNVYGSPAALSYNFALDTYHPLASRRGRKDTTFPFRTSSRVRPNSMKRVEGGWVHTADFAPDSPPSESCNNTC